MNPAPPVTSDFMRAPARRRAPARAPRNSRPRTHRAAGERSRRRCCRRPTSASREGALPRRLLEVPRVLLALPPPQRLPALPRERGRPLRFAERRARRRGSRVLGDAGRDPDRWGRGVDGRGRIRSCRGRGRGRRHQRAEAGEDPVQVVAVGGDLADSRRHGINQLVGHLRAVPVPGLVRLDRRYGVSCGGGQRVDPAREQVGKRLSVVVCEVASRVHVYLCTQGYAVALKRSFR